MKNKILIAVAIVFATMFVNAQNIGLNIGDKIPEIKLLNSDRHWVSLSELKGKIVIISFERCTPSLTENQKLNNDAFKKFKDSKFKKGEGFSIYGVSIGYDYDWDKLLSNNEVLGTQVLDSSLKIWQKFMKQYGMPRQMPYNILINGEGIIIAKGTKGENLITLLKKLEK